MKKQKQIKRLAFILALIMIFSTLFSANVAALKVGDEIGDVLNTDIKTYINGYRIQSYNINGKAAVIAGDLRNYGFNVVYDDATRSSTVTRNLTKAFSAATFFNDSSEPIGNVMFKYVYTDIQAYVYGEKVESFNINGSLAIYFSSLGKYGTFSYDNNARISSFTLANSTGVQTPVIIQAPPVAQTPTTTTPPSQSSGIKYYSGTIVPDYGAYLGISLIDTNSGVLSDGSNFNSYSYNSSLSQSYLYDDLLKELGFKKDYSSTVLESSHFSDFYYHSSTRTLVMVSYYYSSKRLTVYVTDY